MDRPLWQTLIPLFLIGVAAHRAALGFALHATHIEYAVVVLYGLQTSAAIAAAIAIWLGRMWAVGMLIALGVILAGAVLLEGFWLGLRPPLAAVSELLIIALSTAALSFVLRREFAPGGDRDEAL